MTFSSEIGAKILKPKKLANFINYLFGEDQARYVAEIASNNLSKAEKILKNSNIYYEIIGFTQKNNLEVEDEFKINVKDLVKINNQWYNNY